MALSDDLCAAVAALIQAGSTAEPPAAIERAVATKFKLRELTGRRVHVFADGSKTIARLTRTTKLDEYRIAVVVIAKYEHSAKGSTLESVPVNWVEEQKTWVETYVKNVLDSAGLNSSPRLVDIFYPERCEIVTVFDRETLTEEKVFWSEVEVDYRGQVSG